MKIAIKKINGQIVPYTKEDKVAIDELKDGVIYEITIKTMDTRTLQQNKAMYKYFNILASVLNGAGFSINKTLRVDVDWTPASVKELLWRPIMRQLTGKNNTSRLDKKEVSLIYDTLNMALGSRCGISVEFPHEED